MKNTSNEIPKTSQQPKVLLLGGTSDARRLADQLSEQNIEVIYSIAGLVRTPDLSCEVRVGGFSQIGGMQKYLIDQTITHVLDATHPYALNISKKAIEACDQAKIEYIRFERPAWKKEMGDNWLECTDWPQALEKLTAYQNIFLTSGQIPEQIMLELSNMNKQFYLRTAKPPAYQIPKNVNWIKAIGPFDHASEKKWLKIHQIDLIVSKNSGGTATYGKIVAARELGIKVLMFNRPTLRNQLGENCFQFDELSDCFEFIHQSNSKI